MKRECSVRVSNHEINRLYSHACNSNSSSSTKFYHVSWIFISATWFAFKILHEMDFFWGFGKQSFSWHIFYSIHNSQSTLLPVDMFVCVRVFLYRWYEQMSVPAIIVFTLHFQTLNPWTKHKDTHRHTNTQLQQLISII